MVFRVGTVSGIPCLGAALALPHGRPHCHDSLAKFVDLWYSVLRIHTQFDIQ
ncbi:hypothetical protein M378DRAFT_170049 [Amanita muscaria Koide BX008]|uniref:Uncharacterized protein n=1 Tax=Amanita muscaria (strain Koide BX008) TaxID=946122 RepID=A0A0C2SXK5_AMAMK|nr:hypothetical protein M378DRAFT_170049 [Amanita muscaria Koide BX008]